MLVGSEEDVSEVKSIATVSVVTFSDWKQKTTLCYSLATVQTVQQSHNGGLMRSLHDKGRQPKFLQKPILRIEISQTEEEVIPGPGPDEAGPRSPFEDAMPGS